MFYRNKTKLEPVLISILTVCFIFGIFGFAHAQDSTMSSGDKLSKPHTTYKKGNVIFIHPDGTGLNYWNAGRMYWKGPDGKLNWDHLPHMAVYRGHLTDRLASSSNGGATAHSFGYKVQGKGSYGKDNGRLIKSLSGYPGSIMREAGNKGFPIGVVNDGNSAEPGTGAFLAEVDDRKDENEIVRQLLDGRPGKNDTPPWVILGGGEKNFLPKGTPPCKGDNTLDCAVHEDPIGGDGPEREDGRNLLKEAATNGYVIIRTRSEFEGLMAELKKKPNYAPKVLGLFAADHIFNDEAEQELVRLGLVDENVTDPKMGRLLLWGDVPGTPGYNPPTAAEMTDMAITILQRRHTKTKKHFMLVTELESPDNMGGDNNAIGALQALKRADETIGVAIKFQKNHKKTLIVTAADSDAGGVQIVSPPPLDEKGMVGNVRGNIISPDKILEYPADGIEGHRTLPFKAEPDALGNQLDFAISWSGKPDVAGAILCRAKGANSTLLDKKFHSLYNNTDLYRLMYTTLFGKMLPSSKGVKAPNR